MSATMLPDTATPPFDIPTDPLQNSPLFKRAVLLELSVTQLTNTKKIPAEMLRIDANADLLRAHKKLLLCPELDAIYTRDGQMGDYIRKRALPSMFKRGIYFLPVAIVPPTEAEIQKYKNVDRPALIEAFAAVYLARVDAMPGELREAFVRLDYPATAAEAVARFTVKHRYFTLGMPTQMQSVDRLVYEEARQAILGDVEECQANIRALLREEAASWIKALIDKLTGETTTGRQKVVKESFLPAITDWLNNAEQRNLTGDGGFRDLVERMKSAMAGVTRDQFKSDEALRADLKQQFTVLAKEASALITDKRTRAFSFDEE